MITVKDLWEVTTNDIVIYYEKNANKRVKLPAGGRLQIEHAELIVTRIEVVKRSMEPPFFNVCVREAEG